MNLSKSFLASLVLHLLIIALAWGTFKAVQSRPETETKIRVALLLRSAATMPAMPQPISSVPKPVITQKAPAKPIVPAKPIMSPQPVPAAPVSVPANMSKPVAMPAPVPHSEPVALKAPASEPVVTKAPTPPAPNVQADYEEANLGRIRALLSEHLKYPRNALRLRQQGNAVITFTLSPSGEVSALTITKSSDFEILDDAARSLITETASMFPKPSKSVRISVPIEYKIR